MDEMEDGDVCRRTEGKRSRPRHPPTRTTGWGVEREESTHREERADVYTTPGPGKPQTSTFHHWKLYPGYSMDGLTRRRRGCGIDKNPSHPPDAELKPTLGKQGGGFFQLSSEGYKAINNRDPGQRS